MSEGQAGALTITPAMVEAGVEAFRAWFAHPAFADSLLEWPGHDKVGELASLIFASMRLSSPVSASN